MPNLVAWGEDGGGGPVEVDGGAPGDGERAGGGELRGGGRIPGRGHGLEDRREPSRQAGAWCGWVGELDHLLLLRVLIRRGNGDGF